MKRFDLCVCSTTTFCNDVELMVDEIGFSSSLKCLFVVVDRFVQYYIIPAIYSKHCVNKKNQI